MATNSTPSPAGDERPVRPNPYGWVLPNEDFLATVAPEDRASYLQAKLAFQQKLVDFIAATDASWTLVMKPYTDYDAAEEARNAAVDDVKAARDELEAAIDAHLSADASRSEEVEGWFADLKDDDAKAAVSAIQAAVDKLKAALTALVTKNAALAVASAARDKAAQQPAQDLAMFQYNADVMKALIPVEAAHDALNIKVTQVSQTGRDFKVVSATPSGTGSGSTKSA